MASWIVMILSIVGLVLILFGKFAGHRQILLAGLACELIVCISLLIMDR